MGKTFQSPTSLKVLKRNNISIATGGNLGLDMTGDVELRMVFIRTAPNMENRGRDTPSLFTPWEKKRVKEKKGIHRKGGSSFPFLKHQSLEKQ